MNSIDLFHQNLAEIKVSYSHKIRPSEMIKVSRSNDAYEALLTIWEGQLDHIEYFYIILMNRANKIMGYYQLSKGGQTGTVADPKCVFQVALKCCCAAIILAHNHPSGNCKPSVSDIELTRKMKDAGNLLDLPVLDHIILTSETFFSFADEGIM
ncbi:MAG: JAB domain-containing protein [Bacteroidetes bacterium]|nr:JAB domain-containing protein [Bacteroidota bacterium]